MDYNPKTNAMGFSLALAQRKYIESITTSKTLDRKQIFINKICRTLLGKDNNCYCMMYSSQICSQKPSNNISLLVSHYDV